MNLNGHRALYHQRSHVIENFSKRGGVVFCTDLLSRGLTLDVSMIINFDVSVYDPVVTYIARSGVSSRREETGNLPTMVFTIVVGKRKGRGAYVNDEYQMSRIRNELNIVIHDFRR